MPKRLDLNWMDRLMPTMRCDQGCDECCGIVGVTRVEYDQVAEHAARKGIQPVRQGTTCPWFQEGRCAVYEVRPAVCRSFGHHSQMVCPRGYNADMDGWTEAQVDARLRRTLVEAGHQVGDVRLLHEVCMTAEEIGKAIEDSWVAQNVTALTVNGTVPIDPAKPEHRRTVRDMGGLYAYALRAKGAGSELPPEIAKLMADMESEWHGQQEVKKS